MVRDAACRATRADGEPCRSTVVLDSGYCPMHDPRRRAEVAAARERGGQHKATGARLERLVPASLKPVLATQLDALGEVHGVDGEAPTLDPRRATAMASLTSAIVKVYQVGTLEERLQALEERLQDR
jgi:hypothetical protein